MKRLLSVLMTSLAVLLVTACSGPGALTGGTETGTSRQTGENARAVQLDALQQTDETILLQLGRTYSHSFPAGFYQEYALNNLGNQPLAITLVLTGDHNIAFVISRADDPSIAVVDANVSPGTKAEPASFTPEAGVNYRLRVYEVTGDEGAYELTIAQE